MIRIVDVSEFQGPVDWLRVRRAGIAGGIHKATQYRVDHQHAANHQGIPSVGLPHGCYHFLNWDQPGGQQASFYLATAGHFGAGTFPPILDFERYNGRLPTHQDVDDFLHEVEQVDPRRPLLYGNQGDLATLGPLFIGRVAIFLAEYGPNNGQPNGDPQAKRHLTQFPASDVKLWQYTSVGKVDGIAGPCDVSLWLDSQADLDAYTLNPQSQVHIQSVPKPGGATVQKLDPPVHVNAIDVGWVVKPIAGGVHLVTPDGHVYDWGCEPVGMPAGQVYWGARTVLDVQPLGANGFTVYGRLNGLADGKYDYPGPA
jgi:GH25 family lysozyme M1 (1,4-beta-N-acetylmuramidase)